jgi:fructose-1,6-bisphosphatase II
MKIVAQANGKKLSELIVMIQNRDRHKEMIRTILEAGGKVQLFDDGDITFTIATAFGKADIDMFIGIGGAPEGVISAVALKCLGGEMQGRLIPSNDDEYNRCILMGLSNPNAPLRMNQLVNSEECLFAATGITHSSLLKGVQFEEGNQKVTDSIVMYGKHKKVQFVKSFHQDALVD